MTRNHGLTLPEMLLSIVLVAALAGAGFELLSTVRRAQSDIGRHAVWHTTAHRAIEQLRRDVSCGDVAPASVKHAEAIRLLEHGIKIDTRQRQDALAGWRTVRYSLDDSKLYWDDGNTRELLLGHVQELDIVWKPDARGLEVRLSGPDGLDLSAWISVDTDRDVKEHSR
ncbi:MAG: prepilin-type N-terminal cleavage/methylation domain-containing protein [Planctomycetota bacterium]